MLRKLALTVGFCVVAASAAAQEGHTYRFLAFDGDKVRWEFRGTQRVLTYKFVRGPTEIAGATNCGLMTGLEETMEANGVAMADAKRETAAAFAMWTAVTDIKFVEVEHGNANITIGAIANPTPTDVAYANVFYAARKVGEYNPILRTQVCINPLKQWKVGFRRGLERMLGATHDIRYTMAHEIGHTLGLSHPNDASRQVMGYKYKERFRTLQAGDIQGAQILYPTGKSAALKGH